MRSPASFSRFVTVAVFYVSSVQAVTLGALALVMSVNRVLQASGASQEGMFSPEAIVLWVGVPLTFAAIAFAWVQYKRGSLDVYDVRRRRAR